MAGSRKIGEAGGTPAQGTPAPRESGSRRASDRLGGGQQARAVLSLLAWDLVVVVVMLVLALLLIGPWALLAYYIANGHL